MNKKFCRSLLHVLLASIVLIGCASTGPLLDNAKLEDTTKVNLRISEFVLGAGDTVEFAVFQRALFCLFGEPSNNRDSDSDFK